MRITNNIIMNTAKNNINSNKIRMDAINTQMATQKKIMKPSDDPIVAVRSLRLRRNVSELNQYYEKNIPDAESWLEVTETSMRKMAGLLQDIYYAYTQGANGDLKIDDRMSIMTNIEGLLSEFYEEGNASYAERRIFTGYKTDTDFTFKAADTTASYEINETFQVKDIWSKGYVSNCVDQSDINSLAGVPNTADTPQYNQVMSHMLTYSGMDKLTSLTYVDASGVTQTIPVVTTPMSAGADDAYLKPPSGGANYIPETGELIFDSTIENTLRSLGGNAVITAQYTKTGFEKGEIRPFMYYDCTDLNTGIVYTKEKQDIEYQVGFNQTIKVNTEASDVFNLNIMKEVKELKDAVMAVTEAEAKKAELEGMLEDGRYAGNKEQLEEMLKAAQKELDFKNDRMQELFKKGVGSFQKYEQEVNLQVTDEGNRSSRLKLIKQRMAQEKQNFEELLTNNEDRELSDIILDYTAATTAYESSLMATGKISQLSLLNFL